MAGQFWGGRFVGRKDELAHLGAALANAAVGTPGAVVVGGDAGVGKTRLVREVAREAEEGGTRTLIGGCIDLSGGDLPYGPIVEALRDLLPELDSASVREAIGSTWTEMADLLLAPEQRQEPATSTLAVDAARSRLFELLLRLLGQLGTMSPLLLTVEDLHWADRSTMDLLRFLLRNLRHERLLLLLTYRSDELHEGHPLRSLLAELDRSRRAEHLELPPFGPEELRELLDGVLGGPPPASMAERIYERSEGNAFFAEELAAASLVDPTARLPTRLRDVLLVRVGALSAGTRDLLRLAAVIGRRVDHRLLAAASDLDERKLLEALREAVDHHILTPVVDGYEYAIRHALIREAVYDHDLLAGDRLRLHAVVARALRSSVTSGTLDPATTAELAHHWWAAQRWEEALGATVEAGQVAARVYAYAEAHEQLERALSLWEQVEDAGERAGLSHDELLEQAADAARWDADMDRAVTLIRRLLEAESARDPARAAALQERLGRYLWEAGDSAASLVAYETAGHLLAGGPPSVEQARVIAAQAAALMLNSRFRASLARCEEAITMATAVGARQEEGHARNTMGVDLAMTGDPEAGIAALQRARAIAEETNSFEDLCRAYTNLSFVLMAAGRHAESLKVAFEGIEMTRAFGLELTGGGILLCNAADALLRLGRWEEADRVARDALERAIPAGLGLALHLTRVEVAISSGRFDLAEEQLEHVQQESGQVTEPLNLGWLHACLAELAVWRGRHAAARAAVREGLVQIGEGEDDEVALRLCALGIRAEADEAERARLRRAAHGHDGEEAGEVRAVAAGLLERARKLEARVVALAPSLPEARVEAASCAAEHARLDGQGEPERWASVATRWTELQRPYPAAYARYRQAEALLDARAPREAAVALSAAYRAAVDLGAEPLRREVEVLARRARLSVEGPTEQEQHRVARNPRPTDRFALTAREREVLKYVMEGRTNRQIARTLFIEEKTASVHVSNILTKLGVANRVEAAAVAYRLKLLDDPA